MINELFFYNPSLEFYAQLLVGLEPFCVDLNIFSECMVHMVEEERHAADGV